MTTQKLFVMATVAELAGPAKFKPSTPIAQSNRQIHHDHGEAELDQIRSNSTAVVEPNPPSGGLQHENFTAPITNNADSHEAPAGQISESIKEKTTNALGEPAPAGEAKKPCDGRDKNGPKEEDDETNYPKGLPLAILTFGLCMVTFVVALDNTIIGIYN